MTEKNVSLHSKQGICLYPAGPQDTAGLANLSIVHPLEVPIKWRMSRWVGGQVERWTNDHHTQQLER